MLAGLFLSGLCFAFISCNTDRQGGKAGASGSETPFSDSDESAANIYKPVYGLLILPENPAPGQSFRILSTGGQDLDKARITITGDGVAIETSSSISGDEMPCWRIDKASGISKGNYEVIITVKGKQKCGLSFTVAERDEKPASGVIWKTAKGWDAAYEVFYSAWVSSLFRGCTEQSSWKALHEVTRDSTKNFLYNCLQMKEDDPASRHTVIMEPDCADNPFFLRAYFAWKLGLPFGYHICNRGSLNKAPSTGEYISNETPTTRDHPVDAFNAFLRRLKDGVHSGTARTALDDENSDYYPLALEPNSLAPGTVYADPYGHTFILTSLRSQTSRSPGLLLAVDAQPDGTIAIKRFWKGNFLFNTSGVVGEPGFKAFRPLALENGRRRPMPNVELSDTSRYKTYSLMQRRMPADTFYYRIDRIINPQPLDAEAAMLDLITALHEQLLVRVNSVANAEIYFSKNPGAVIPMPSNASGIFLALGQWENFSTPNRDLRLLIAMDAVISFPDMAAVAPESYKMKGTQSADEARKKLLSFLSETASDLKIEYIKSDGSPQILTISEILERRAAFEMAYNPNDGPEIRWGAPENSKERSTCRRKAPASQLEKMRAARHWFTKRLHPPT